MKFNLDTFVVSTVCSYDVEIEQEGKKKILNS